MRVGVGGVHVCDEQPHVDASEHVGAGAVRVAHAKAEGRRRQGHAHLR